MTMLSFRVGDALRKYLVRLGGEAEADTWAQMPFQDDELTLQKISAWGVAEDWAEWQHAAW